MKAEVGKDVRTEDGGRKKAESRKQKVEMGIAAKERKRRKEKRGGLKGRRLTVSPVGKGQS